MTDTPVRRPGKSPDPMEDMLAAALRSAGLRHLDELDPGNPHRLDFQLPDEAPNGVAVEVKQMHSPRISAQMARHGDVIAAQGPHAVRLLSEALAALGRERAAGRAHPASADAADPDRAAGPSADGDI